MVYVYCSESLSKKLPEKVVLGYVAQLQGCPCAFLT